MTIEEKNIFVYKKAYEFLLSIKPELLSELDLQNKYFVGDNKNFSSLEDIFERLIVSAQNYQRMPNVINYKERKGKIKNILFDFDIYKIKNLEAKALSGLFKEEFGVITEDSKRNSWYKWSSSIIDAAKFLADFSNVDDFKKFVSLFDYNLSTRIALPLLISAKIKGIGFALACDFLKELGYLNYPKPDVHLIDIFESIKLSNPDGDLQGDHQKISCFEAIVRMSDDCKKIDDSATPYKIDKIIWLICSGRFYADDINVGNHKEDFIQLLQENI